MSNILKKKTSYIAETTNCKPHKIKAIIGMLKKTIKGRW